MDNTKTTTILESVLIPMYGIKPASHIMRSISRYKGMGLSLDLIEFDAEKKVAIFAIKQFKLINGFILNNKQLYERGHEILDFDTSFKVHINPRVFEPPFGEITLEWIEAKMKELGISRQDLIKQLALDPASLSRTLSGGMGMTRTFKAAIYYYFLQYEINKDIRQEYSELRNEIPIGYAEVNGVLTKINEDGTVTLPTGESITLAFKPI